MPHDTAAPARGRRRRSMLVLLPGAGLAGLLAVAVAAGTLAGSRPPGAPGSAGGTATDDARTAVGRDASPAAFTGFDSCEDLLDHYRTHAARLLTPYGLPVHGGREALWQRGARTSIGVEEGAAQPATPAPAAAPPSDGGTNVQVAGVDEADVAKRAADLVYAVRGAPARGASWNAGRDDDAGMTVSRVGSTGPEVLGRLRVPGLVPDRLLLHGTTVVLVGTGPAATPAQRRDLRPWPLPRPRSRVVQVDVTDPRAPRVVRTLDVDGEVLAARLVDGVARLTVSSPPAPLPQLPDLPQGRPADPRRFSPEAATTGYRAVVRTSTLDRWLPSYTLTSADGSAARTGRLVECQAVAAPSRFAGIDTLTLLSFDLRSAEGIGRWSAGGVVASGAIVHATPSTTYVATTDVPVVRAGRGPADLGGTTQVHALATEGAAAPRYLASGHVPGRLLGQFSMDEHEGVLRVASTRGTTESLVTVLRRDGDGLEQVGQVAGLGRGETIHAVRFMGDVGYVVTFRQTDPLYTVDLSDPARPRVTGELKIPGYSAYLHPVGEGLLLGVGQDADDRGRRKGLQMSLFDVADPAAPRRLAAVGLPGASSDVEGDHHAFTYAGGTAFVPFARESFARGRTTVDAGVVAVRLRGRSLSEPLVLRARGDGPVVVGPDGFTWPEVALRTFADERHVVTVTTRGIAVHDAVGLGRVGFAAF